MKTVFLFLALLLFSQSCFAQVPVPLEEWTTVQGSIEPYFSTIPKFGKQNQEHVTLLRRCFNGGTYCESQTWFNRYAGDTVNQFLWGRYLPEGLVALDFNGDGNNDYINNMGVLMMGGLDNTPDTGRKYTLQEHPHIRAGSRKNTSGDVNGDGKDDIFYYHIADKGYPYLMSIILGNADVSKVKKAHITSPVLSDTTMHEVAVVLFKNKQGAWRLLTYTWANFFFKNPPPGKWVNIPDKSEIRLYGVEFEQQLDSTTSVLTKLDGYQSPEWAVHADDYYKNNWSPVAINGGGTLYQSQYLDKILFYPDVSMIDGNKLSSVYPIFDISNDRFNLLHSSGGCAYCTVLDHSIDGDSLEDLSSKLNEKILLYSINTTTYIQHLRYSWELTNSGGGSQGDVYSISDVNQDGINDIAALFVNSFKGNTFVIIKGKDWKTVGVNNDAEHKNTITIGIPYPTPQNNTQVQVPIHVPMAGQFELQLYSIEGKLIETIWKRQTEGEQDITIMVRTSELLSGTYMLRLTNGVQKAEQLLTITK